MTLLLIACAVPASLAQQSSSSPGAPVGAAAHGSSPLAQSSKMGTLPGTLRQQADHRFLAQRGISWESRSTAHGNDPGPALADRLSRARAARRGAPQRLSPDASTPGTWQPLGPAQVATAAYGLVTGRITSLAADPNDSSGNTLYVGSSGGGVWKSTNAAGSPANTRFLPLTDDLPAFTKTLGSLSIGAITVQPASSSIVLAGTGDPNNALDSYYGAGILRSTDGGLHWTLIQGTRDAQQGGLTNYSFAGNGFAGFAWSSVTPSLVVAAVADSLEGEIVNAGTTQYMEAGLYYSSDAGQTWYLGVIEDSASAIVQSPNKAGSPPGNSATSVLWNPVRKRFYAAVRYHGYYESLDGITWTRLANQPGAGLSASACPTNPGGTGQTSCPIFRGALAVQPVTGDMFALTTDLNDLDQGLFQDVCSTNGLAVSSCASNTVAFGKQLGTGALENGQADPSIPPTTIPLAEYNLTLAAVASQQDTILFAGTEDIFRCSLANSCTWRNTTNIETCAAAQVAPSQHATESTFGGSGLLYFANDGGLWRSTDTVAQSGSVCAPTDASHYQNLNSGIGSLAEIEHFSVSPGSSTTLLAGVGGFGTASTTTGQGAWQQLLTGEGSYTAIDPQNTQNWYTDAGSGVDIFRCTAGAGCNAAGFGTAPVIGSTEDDGDADYFTEPAPWILDPLNPANLLLGTCRVWRGPATGGSGWSAANLISPMLDGNQQSFCNGNAELRSIGAGLDANASSGTEQMYAGMAGPYDGGGTIPGHVFGSTVPASGGTTTWTDLYNSPVTNSMSSQFNSGGFSVSSIAVDPHDPTGQTVYVTIQGFSGNGISDGEVYGSTDGGAHWLNLTNSLPLSPANGIVVDPNVPSTLYVALDTGVYYTQNVAACSDPRQTCWAVYGAGLPTAPVTSLEVYSAAGSSILEASTYGRGIWALGLLTAPAQGTLSPASQTFANQQVATTSPAATFTLTNTGTTSMTITDVEVSGDYAQTNNCGSRLAASSHCSIQVTFTPTVTGDRPGALTVYANVSGGMLTSTLDGAGLAPGMLTATPASLSFPPTVQGTSAPAQTLSVENTGGEPVQLHTLSVTTDYALSSDACSGTTLAPLASCSVAVIFSPTGLQSRPGTLKIPSNLPASPLLVQLSGTGLTPAALAFSPSSLAFPSTQEGSVSSAQNITLNNTGGGTAQLQSETVSGDFQIASNACGASLPGGASCLLQVQYAPSSQCGTQGLLTIAASAPGVQATASLTGVDGSATTPCAVTLSPTSLAYGSAVIGSTTPAQTITLTNGSRTTVQLGGPTLQGNYSFAGGSCAANTRLAPAPAAGDSCTLQIAFRPQSRGDQHGSLTVPFNGGVLTALLDGSGLAPANLDFSTSLLSFGPVVEGQSSPAQMLTLSNTGDVDVNLQPAVISPQYAETSNCGAVLPAGQQCTLSVVFSPTALGEQAGTVTVSGTSGGLQLHATAALDGTGLAPARLVFSPTSLAFGSLQTGKASAQQAATLSNTGGVSAQLGPATLTGDYALAANSCGASLPPAGTCVLQVTFNPSAVGARPGLLSVSTTDGASHASVSLSGTGTPPPVLVLTPTALVFPATGQGASAAAESITVANIGTTPITLQPFSLTGDFAISADTCSGTPLNPTYSCTLLITFTPTGAGVRTGLLTVSDSTESHTATLTGTGLSPATDTLSTTSLTFGPQVFGTVSPGKSVTVTNSGGSTLGSISTTITGPFIAANNCGTILGGGLTCSIAVSFAPTGAGNETGQLTITDAQRSQVVTLSGQGVLPPQAVATPSSLDFGGYAVAVASPAQLVTMTNNGKTPLTGFSAATTTAAFAVASNSCGDTIAAGASCTLGITFTPQQPGNAVDQLTLSSPSLNGPLTVALSGSGEDFQLSVTGSASDLITDGQTASYHVVVTPVGVSAGTLTISCTGVPANAACTLNPPMLTVSGGTTGSITVTIATGLSTTSALRGPARSGRSRPQGEGPGREIVWRSGAALALLLPCLLLPGRSRRTFLALLVAAALVLVPVACGVHASGGSSASTGSAPAGTTPAGKYAITVTASFPGAQRTANLTLTVE